MLVIGILLVILGLILIWFGLPFSPLKKEYDLEAEEKEAEELLTSNLPLALEKYLEKNGYLEKKYLGMKIESPDLIFSNRKFRYYQKTNKSGSVIYVETSWFLVPVEYYKKTASNSQITKVGKLFKINKNVDLSCLPFCLFNPFLFKSVKWEEIDEYQVKGQLEENGKIVEAIFLFNQEYQLIECKSVFDNQSWSLLCYNYEVNENGIKTPTSFKALWTEKDEDDFIASNVSINYLFEKKA